MYAELSDFFYVWLKRTVGHLYPEWFAAQLTDKDEEAVANPARFAGLGRKKKAMAEQDYERKMEAAFREMNRVLAVVLYSTTFRIGAVTPVQAPGAGIYYVQPESPAELAGLNN